jgi:N-acylneuraminate cytidylyltransferase
MAYSIVAAKESGVFDSVVVSTDSELYADIARYYGAEVPFLRDAGIAGSVSPDIEWVLHALEALKAGEGRYAAYSILRPTSPFRKPATILRAWRTFLAEEGVDSLRAVEKAAQHPGKMWVVRGNRMVPLLPLTPEDRPWHSQQKAALPEVYVQNASLEIAWTEMTLRTRTIAGQVLLPFFTEGDEGLDINAEEDWWYAEHMMQKGEARLPTISQAPFPNLPAQSS